MQRREFITLLGGAADLAAETLRRVWQRRRLQGAFQVNREDRFIASCASWSDFSERTTTTYSYRSASMGSIRAAFRAG